MNSSTPVSIIRQKYLKLLEETSSFFSGDHEFQEHDVKHIEQMRTSALLLAQEAATPGFVRFITYLLGLTGMNADYPLQAIRMLCLTALALREQPLAREQRDEVLTAAFLADVGFRPAWLGHHGTHSDITVFHVKSLGFAWFTPTLESLITKHNIPADDVSPSRILSLVGKYLSMVYETGVEQTDCTPVSPAKAVEILLSELDPDASGLRVFIQAVSAFPLGSWVQLNNGEAALVIGPNKQNPLRPRVGVYRSNSSAVGRWDEFDLETKTDLHIAREIPPGPAQQAFLNAPEIYIPGWAGANGRPDARQILSSLSTGSLPVTSGQAATALPAALRTLDDYRAFLLRNINPGARAGPSENGSNGKPLARAPEADLQELSSAEKRPLLKFYREELVKLRATWEQQVHTAEQVTSSLKAPLLESYRRENELMSAILESVEAQAARSAAAAEEAQKRAALPGPPGGEAPEAPVDLSDDPQAGLEEVQRHLAAFQERLDKDRGTLSRLKEKFRETIDRLEARDDTALPALIAFIKQWQAKLVPMQQTLKRTEDEAGALSQEWKTLHATAASLLAGPKTSLALPWKETVKPRMEGVLRAAQRDVSMHRDRLRLQEQMVGDFCAEAKRLV